jgi:hypothetical protein
MSSTFYPFGFAGLKEALLDQAEPVKDTWYTVLEATPNARLFGMGLTVMGTDEDVEVRITADDAVIVMGTVSGYYPITHEVAYHLYLFANYDGIYLTLSVDSTVGWPLMLDCRSLTVEIRKVSENGTGNLKACVAYSTYQ